MTNNKEPKDMTLEEMQKASEPMDATPLIKMALSEMTTEQKEIFLEALKEGFESSGEMLVRRAFLEGVLEPKEFIQWKKEYGVTFSDMSAPLQGFFNARDGAFPENDGKEDHVVVVTMSDSPVYKMKKILEPRLNIQIRTPEQCLELMEKDEEFQEAMKDHPEYQEWKKRK